MDMITNTLEQEAWLKDLLIHREAATDQGQRYLDSALRGYTLHLLKQQRAHFGFVPIPLWTYLGDLASAAKVSLDALLASVELESQPQVSIVTASRIAVMLRRIGLNVEEALTLMRLSFAEVHGYSTDGDIGRTFRGSLRRTDGAFCSNELLQLERQYPPQLADELAAIEEAARVQYTTES